MASKKASVAAVEAVEVKKAAAAPHTSYFEMVRMAIETLKERSGSSRQAIKKYILANYTFENTTPAAFNSHINNTIRKAVLKGLLNQPKGPSGPIKLTKEAKLAKPKAVAVKEAKPKKAAEPKSKKVSTLKSPADKAEKPAKTTTTKKAEAVVEKPAAKKDAPAPKKAAPKKAAAPAAVVEAPVEKAEPAPLTKTKSGRVSKRSSSPSKAAVVSSPKKAATPKSVASPKAAATRKTPRAKAK